MLHTEGNYSRHGGDLNEKETKQTDMCAHTADSSYCTVEVT